MRQNDASKCILVHPLADAQSEGSKASTTAPSTDASNLSASSAPSKATIRQPPARRTPSPRAQNPPNTDSAPARQPPPALPVLQPALVLQPPPRAIRRNNGEEVQAKTFTL